MRYRVSNYLSIIVGVIGVVFAYLLIGKRDFGVYKLMISHGKSATLMCLMIILCINIAFHFIFIRDVKRIYQERYTIFSTGYEKVFIVNVIFCVIELFFVIINFKEIQFIIETLLKTKSFDVMFNILNKGRDFNIEVFWPLLIIVILNLIINILVLAKADKDDDQQAVNNQKYKLFVYGISLFLVITATTSFILKDNFGLDKSNATINFSNDSAYVAEVLLNNDEGLEYERKYIDENGKSVFSTNNKYEKLHDIINRNGKYNVISSVRNLYLDKNEQIFIDDYYKIYDEKGAMKFILSNDEDDKFEEIVFLNDAIIVSQDSSSRRERNSLNYRNLAHSISGVDDKKKNFYIYDYDSGEKSAIKDVNGKLLQGYKMLVNESKDMSTISILTDVDSDVETFSVYSLKEKKVIATYQMSWLNTDINSYNKFSKEFNVAYRNGYFGFINGNGKVVVDYQFTRVESFYGGKAKVTLENGNVGFIGRDGILTSSIAPNGDDISRYYADTMYLTIDNEKYLFSIYMSDGSLQGVYGSHEKYYIPYLTMSSDTILLDENLYSTKTGEKITLNPIGLANIDEGENQTYLYSNDYAEQANKIVKINNYYFNSNNKEFIGKFDEDITRFIDLKNNNIVILDCGQNIRKMLFTRFGEYYIE